jgi:hypothetical protein
LFNLSAELKALLGLVSQVWIDELLGDEDAGHNLLGAELP